MDASEGMHAKMPKEDDPEADDEDQAEWTYFERSMEIISEYMRKG